MPVTEKKPESIVVVKRDSGVALIILDNQAKYNYLGSAIVDEIERAVLTVRDDAQVKGAVVISGKPDSFILGADVFELRKCTKFEEFKALSVRGQSILNLTENLSKPIVAAINGPCLGGGLELALACHGRVATDNSATQLGLPETRLGIIPGLGGSQRLPRLIGLKVALELILSGDSIKAAQALEIGLLDQVVSPELLIETAEKMVLELAERGGFAGEKDKLKATMQCRVPLDMEKARKLIAVSERAVRVRTKGNYPAQTRVLSVILAGLEQGQEKGLEIECQTFSELAASPTAANLMALYFATDYATASARSMISKFNVDEVKHLALVGAGIMGTSLSVLAATGGLRNKLLTREPRASEVSENVKALARATHKGIDADNLPVAVVTAPGDIADSDLVLECLIEDLEEKIQAFKRCESVVAPDCVIASNSSSIPISQLASKMERPERCVGLHFFHPVSRMPLVEVIVHPQLSKQALAKAASFVLALGKIPLMVKDCPGFLINRLLTVYLFEVAEMGSAQVPTGWVEDAVLDFGVPIGPWQLMDEIGTDVSFGVACALREAFGARMTSPPVLDMAIAMGIRGRKSGVGFYRWEGDKRLSFNPDIGPSLKFNVVDEKCPPEQRGAIIEQLFYPMIDEAARCLEEKIINKPREVDVGCVMGFGFPAFRGGLLRYADSIGLPRIVEWLDTYYASSSYRPRTVSNLLRKYVEQGRGFYSSSSKDE